MPHNSSARVVLAVFGSTGTEPGTALTINEARPIARRMGVAQRTLIDGAIAGTNLGWFKLGGTSETLILTAAGAAELRKGPSPS
jgi:hypothetical protein